MIRVKDLYKSFGGHEILRGLNLQIDSGETMVILGRSGVGKSVLLKQIIGLQKPDSGSVEIDGVPISTLFGIKLYQAVKEMGMLFQGAALLDSLNVYENTAFYLKQHRRKEGYRLPESEIRIRVAEALKMVDLEGTEEEMPANLSGGMKKRAALARLIVYRPKILLYDEPTTGLDPITAMQINDLILQIQRELKATSIVVTHDLCSAFHVADKIALNHQGQIVYTATKEEFVTIDDPLIQSFLHNSIPNGLVR
ncbi:MAG: putative ribonucleotide transport ATP-binding protein mkl [Chlamydiales bacterium]|nr:putative ribonucleotide transport ATP-binding protein mkl [Chlamydiales bacterium]MCH9620125.1 putative ribonucleotide transport ATP-binding protein mkl [Chlamydiales bacterium]MCH9623595.1 putative ribonucleotide transport ATP-binding protein mkl [Chlamydiales bacterium]